MGFVSLRIRYTGIAIPGVLKRELPRAQKAAFFHIGVLWHKLFRPKHFTQKGGREYGYAKRAGERFPRGSKQFRSSYTGQKLRRFGHTRPNEFTGVTRALSKIRNVKATSKGVKIRLRTPALNFHKFKDGSSPADEMRVVSARELRFLLKRFVNELFRQFAKIRGRKKTVRLAA